MSAFEQELVQRWVEAVASHDAAVLLGDELLIQITSAEVDDLRALADRNDVALPVEDLS